MSKVTAADFAKHFGRYRTQAQSEPVAITSHGEETCYLVSAAEYHRLKRQDREVYDIADMPADLLRDIIAAEIEPGHEHLDALMGE